MKTLIAVGWLAAVLLPAGASGAYVVKPGDCLGVIARSHGTTVDSLMKENGLRSDRIVVGQCLKVPGAAGGAPAATGTGRHRVQKGETLWRIGRRHGVSVEELMRLNGLRSPQSLRAGQWLVLGGAPKAAPAPGVPASPKAQGGRSGTVTATTESGGSAAQAQGRDEDGQAVSFRTIKLKKAETVGSLAKRHGMTVEQLNIINGWSFAPEILLGADSEAHVLNPAVH